LLPVHLQHTAESPPGKGPFGHRRIPLVPDSRLLVRWLRDLIGTVDAARPTFWPEEAAPAPVIMRP